MVECKVFSATKARERRELGGRVTEYLKAAAQKGLAVHDKQVTQSSDSEFHCVTITLWMVPAAEA